MNCTENHDTKKSVSTKQAFQSAIILIYELFSEININKQKTIRFVVFSDNDLINYKNNKKQTKLNQIASTRQSFLLLLKSLLKRLRTRFLKDDFCIGLDSPFVSFLNV